MYDEIKEQARAAMQELLELAAPKPGSLVVVGWLLERDHGRAHRQGAAPLRPPKPSWTPSIRS